MGGEGIAIVGMACRYADARSPAELWENVLAQRRAFRRVPAERLRLADYAARAPDDPDSTYLREAAVLADWELDRVRFRVAGPTFRTADLTHWLALDVAAQALDAAGFADGAGLPREATGVLVGNSLTGEFSRSHLLRQRWPYVRRVLGAALAAEGWEERRREDFLGRLETTYKAPFPAPSEESLAGGLANTIAGRICNHFDLHGGGYTVDGACASSLLAVAQACTALAAGDLDVVLAGGVDLSLDPFEMVGFARAGALAAGDMRVFDVRSAGFIPGEGCGFVVLMREGEAAATGRRVHAVIRGWGVSSDGHGGISRPEAAGQRLALARAYRRAGFGIDTVACFEAHGTGTAVGDATELAALAQELRAARAPGAAVGGGGGGGAAARDGAAGGPPAAIGSVKANLGHTKAAAGIAGLIKAAMAVESQVLPPTTGCDEPQAEVAGGGADPVLRVLAAAEAWPAGRPPRAGVSAMGFGGVNAHLAIEGTAAARRRPWSAAERRLAAPPADTELVALAAADRDALRERVRQLAALAPRMSRAEVGDLAAEMARGLGGAAGTGGAAAASADVGGVRAAVVAASPDQLAERLAVLLGWLEEGVERRLDARRGVFLGGGRPDGRVPRVGLLLTGQGSPSYWPGGGAAAASAGGAGGAARRCFPELGDLYELAARSTRTRASAEGPAVAGPAAGGAAEGEAGADTAVAQPAITAHNLAGLWVLERLGVRASVAVGHSLGEIAALCWAGACDEGAALRLAAARGAAMAARGEAGAMASIAAPAAVVEELVEGTGAHVAAHNAPARTVISGAPGEVAMAMERAARRGLAATRLKVTRAFHSPRVAAAAADLERYLGEVPWAPARRPLASTVSGEMLPPDGAPGALLLRQLTSPVRFTAALAAAAPLADVWVEVGPGRVLADLAAESVEGPVLAMDTGGPSLAPLLGAAGALFASGAAVDLAALSEGRFTRPFDVERPPRFLANPCESAPLPLESGAPDERAADQRAATGHAGGERALAGERVAARATDGAGSVLGGVGGGLGAREDAAGAREHGRGVETALDVVRGLVAARAELPEAAVHADSRLLADLHLNSITVGQLVAEASRRLGLAPPASPTDYAPATVAQVADALSERVQREGGAGAPAAGSPGTEAAGPAGAAAGGDQPAGIDSWVRAFEVALVERRPGGGPAGASAARMTARATPAAAAATTAVMATMEDAGGAWQVIALPGDLQAVAIAEALDGLPGGGRGLAESTASTESAAGAADTASPGGAGRAAAAFGRGAGGVLLCVPAEVDEEAAEHLALFTAAARAAGAVPAPARWVVVQRGGGGGGFARTLHLERPAGATWLIDLPAEAAPERAAAWVAAEVAAAPAGGAAGEGTGFYREAHYGGDGVRRVPVLRALATAGSERDAAGGGLAPGEVILATGGGKGIGAECALALARASGARLALLGRADPAVDAELAANLERMAAAGVRPLYVRADVTDAAAVAAAVARVRTEMGPVAALLHAAGVNAPRRIEEIDEAGLRRTAAPKSSGLRHLLAALAARHTEAAEGGAGLKLLVAFGSIIARTGLRGEAEYALANEWLARRVERFAAAHPACRCLTVEWSVWSGVGMGERLGTLEALRHQGIEPIPPGAGAEALLRLLADGAVRGPVVVSSRFGHSPTLALERPPLPLLRFLETPRVYYPGIELVTDVEVSAEHDPHLADHVFRGEPLFAAVLGLEAMAQAAAALCGAAEPPQFEQVELRRPVAVSPGRASTIRLAALVRAPGRVEVAVRDSSTGFAADHFRAVCVFAPAPAAAPSAAAAAGTAAADIGLVPGRDLYGGILFHQGRFRRLAGYRQLRATECLAEIVPDGTATWFGRYLPQALLLGDPAARDAAIHAIQACIPQAQLLPVGVDRILAARLTGGERLFATARERRRDGDTFTYDLDIVDRDGTPRERWIGLRLRAVDATRLPPSWAAPLLAPYLERRLAELLPAASPRVALEPAPPGGDRRAASAAAVERLLGAARLLHRPDGRPEIAGGPPVSIAHADPLVLVVAGAEGQAAAALGCDVEAVAPRPPEVWRGLLGSERAALAELIARRLPPGAGGAFDGAATRVWTAAEALRKAGAPAGTPLLLESVSDDGWVLLGAGGLRVACYAGALRELGGPFALAVAAPHTATAASAAREAIGAAPSVTAIERAAAP